MIYIPLWLDLLFFSHSVYKYNFNIYIPLWLDLLLVPAAIGTVKFLDLHSTMVRFIIMPLNIKKDLA